MDEINQLHNPATLFPGEKHPVIFQYRFDRPLSHFASGVATELYILQTVANHFTVRVIPITTPELICSEFYLVGIKAIRIILKLGFFCWSLFSL
jgi:hypothetical protein